MGGLFVASCLNLLNKLHRACWQSSTGHNMLGRCKICGYNAGIFNLKKKCCKSCFEREGSQLGISIDEQKRLKSVGITITLLSTGVIIMSFSPLIFAWTWPALPVFIFGLYTGGKTIRSNSNENAKILLHRFFFLLLWPLSIFIFILFVLSDFPH